MELNLVLINKTFVKGKSIRFHIQKHLQNQPF